MHQQEAIMLAAGQIAPVSATPLPAKVTPTTFGFLQGRLDALAKVLVAFLVCLLSLSRANNGFC
jgi:hypothetical protein